METVSNASNRLATCDLKAKMLYNVEQTIQIFNL